MKIEELILQYKTRYNEHNISEKLSEDIKKITPKDYSDYYIKLYRKHFGIFMPPGLTLTQINDFFSPRVVPLFDNDSCIFETNNDLINKEDYEFFVSLNNSKFVKDLLDEDNNHFPIDEGAKLKGTLISVCFKRHYEKNINALDMYSEAWWKLSKSHPFSNGNKRTAFIGVKSMLFSDSLMHFMTMLVENFKSTFNTRINDPNELDRIHKGLKKSQIMGYKKPTKNEILEAHKEYSDIVEENIWQTLFGSEVINTILDRVVSEIAFIATEEISSDYILSKFIAGIPHADYKKDNEAILKEVLTIIKAELTISLLINEKYITDRTNLIAKEMDSAIYENFNKKLEYVVAEYMKKKYKR